LAPPANTTFQPTAAREIVAILKAFRAARLGGS
jgi:hypothetical protein